MAETTRSYISLSVRGVAGATVLVGFIATLYLADDPGATVPTVPLDALVKLPTKPSESGVFLLVREGEKDVARYRPVTLGDTLANRVGVTGGLARKVGPGDVVVNLPGTPHWLSQIDGTIEYVEIAGPNVDPAPGVERAEVRPAPPR